MLPHLRIRGHKEPPPLPLQEGGKGAEAPGVHGRAPALRLRAGLRGRHPGRRLPRHLRCGHLPPALPGAGALLRDYEEGHRGAGPEMPGAYRRGDRRPVRRPPEPCGGMDLQGHEDAAGGEAHRMRERQQHPAEGC